GRGRAGRPRGRDLRGDVRHLPPGHRPAVAEPAGDEHHHPLRPRHRPARGGAEEPLVAPLVLGRVPLRDAGPRVWRLLPDAGAVGAVRPTVLPARRRAGRDAGLPLDLGGVAAARAAVDAERPAVGAVPAVPAPPPAARGADAVPADRGAVVELAVPRRPAAYDAPVADVGVG